VKGGEHKRIRRELSGLKTIKGGGSEGEQGGDGTETKKGPGCPPKNPDTTDNIIAVLKQAIRQRRSNGEKVLRDRRK